LQRIIRTADIDSESTARYHTPLSQSIEMGRPPIGRGSQKTCLKNRPALPWTGAGHGRSMQSKRKIPGSMHHSVRGFCFLSLQPIIRKRS